LSLSYIVIKGIEGGLGSVVGGYGHFTTQSKGATPGMLCTMAASFSIASVDTTATANANRSYLHSLASSAVESRDLLIMSNAGHVVRRSAR